MTIIFIKNLIICLVNQTCVRWRVRNLLNIKLKLHLPIYPIKQNSSPLEKLNCILSQTENNKNRAWVLQPNGLV